MPRYLNQIIRYVKTVGIELGDLGLRGSKGNLKVPVQASILEICGIVAFRSAMQYKTSSTLVGNYRPNSEEKSQFHLFSIDEYWSD